MANENDFKIGDVVTLKSGGPKMTVYFLDSSKDYIYCTWHSVSEDSFKERKFKSNCLIK